MDGNPGWHEDGVDDGPSSLDMLLGWMRTRNNAERWMDTAGKMDGSRLELAQESQDFMCECGIDYRTPEGIRTRLLILERELQDAEDWMKNRGCDTMMSVRRRSEQYCRCVLTTSRSSPCSARRYRLQIHQLSTLQATTRKKSQAQRGH